MAYTQDQYLGFAEQLAPYLSDPTQLMQQAGKLGLGVEDVAKAAQTFNPNITASQIQSYFQPAGINYQPAGALPSSPALSAGALPSTDQTNAENLKSFITSNINNPQAIAQYAKQFGASDIDLSAAAGVPVEQVHDYFRKAGMPLGTMLTGTLSRDIGTDQNVKQLQKGEDVVTEQAIGMQGNKVLVQQYDAYGQPMGTRLAEPNAPDYVGWLQALGIVTAATGLASGFEALTGSTASELAAADIALGGQGGVQGASTLSGTGALPGGIVDTLQSALPSDLVSAGKTFVNTYNQVRPYLQGANALYQASKGNLENAILSGLGSAGGFGVPGASDAANYLNAALQASKGNFMPAVTTLMGSDLGKSLGNTKIVGDLTLNDTLKGYNFLQAVQSGNPTQILASANQMIGSQDLNTATSAMKLVDLISNPNANPLAIADATANLANNLTKSATTGKTGKTDLAVDAFQKAKAAGASDEDAFMAASEIDPRITAQGVAGSSLTDPRYFEGPGGFQQTGVQFGGYEIPGLSLGQQEQLVGSAMYAPLRDIDEEGNETTYSGLRQQIQMMDANGQPVLDAAGKPIIYEALYDPKDGSIRYSVKVGDDDTRLAQGSNLLSQKPQIGFDDEGNRVLFNPVNNRVIAVLEATSDAPVSGTKLDDLAATDSQLDDITFAALEGLRQGAEADDGELSVEGGETVDLLDPTKKPGEGLSDLDTIVLDGKQPGDTAEKPGGDTGGKPGDKDGKPGGANDGLGTDTLPGAGADTLPGEGADTLPGAGADTLPGEGADTLPGEGADTLPGDGADTLPGDGADTLPGDGADTLPGDGADTLPGDGADTLPGDGADTVPGSVIKDDEEPPPKIEVEPEPPEVTCPEGYHLGPDGKTCVPDEKEEEPPKPPVVTAPPVVTKPPVTTTPKGALPASQQAGPITGSEIARLQGKMLESKVLQERQIDPLAAMKQRIEEMNSIDPMLAVVLSQRLGLPQPKPETPSYTYGQETSIDDILGLNSREYAEGGFVEPLKAAGGAMNPQFMYRAGGLGTREDFRDGKHVAGEGDGQSDDIPAWLADGEFVFPADVVSALGNGSTKAGTDKLYKMMHEIRARARSTKEKDLPPPAHKSPLDYLKKGK